MMRATRLCVLQRNYRVVVCINFAKMYANDVRLCAVFLNRELVIVYLQE